MMDYYISSLFQPSCEAGVLILLLLLFTLFSNAIAFFVFYNAFLTFSSIWLSGGGGDLPLLTLKSCCEDILLMMSCWEEMRFID